MHHVTIVNRSAWRRYAGFAVLASILQRTALGLTPSAFVLAYVGQGHFGYQLIAAAVVVAVMLGSLVIKNRRGRLRQVH
jgi:hypothetical protein